MAVIQLPPNSTGTVVDTVTGVNGVREVVVLGDPTTPSRQAAVTSAGAVQVDGSGVTQPVSVQNFPATQAVSEAHLSNLDIALSALRDAITKTGATTKTLADVVAALQATITTNATVENWPATQAVSGSVSVSNLPATQPVSGTVSVGNLPATQPVSGSVSVTNLPVTQAVSGTVSVGNFPVTQPVSGTVSVSNTVGVQDLFSQFDNFGGWQQTNGGVLTFTATAACDLIWVRVDDGSGSTAVATCDPSGGVPAAHVGIPLDDGVDKPITVSSSSVKVFSATTGSYVKVWGFRY